MSQRITKSLALRIPLQAYLTSDHISPATGKTIAITISKNGAAYGNPSVGATNAVEIANGSYYVDLSATDTGTAGPLFVRGTATGTDDLIAIYDVADPTVATVGANIVQVLGTAIATPATAGVIDVNVKNINNVSASAVTTIKAVQGLTTADTIATYTGNTPQTGDSFARIGVAGAGLTNIDLPNQTMDITGNITGNLSGSVGSVTGLTASNLDATVSSRLASASYTAPDNAGITANGVLLAAIKAKTDQLTFTIANKVDSSIQAAGDFAQAAADKVWATAARTLTAFGFSVTTTAADQQASADELLNRNIAGGGSGGARIVRDAIRLLRNRRRIAAGTLTVYQEDDTTPAFTATTATAAGNPLTEVDPA